jgi:tetratricopeptide (TPR) repeat protein
MFILNNRITILICIVLLIFSSYSKGQSSDELYKLSKVQLEKGSFAQALSLINQGINKDSSKADYYLLRANIQFNLNKYDASIRDCYEALNREPDKPEVYFLRGRLCQVTKSFGGAILFFGKTLKFSRNEKLTYDAYLNRGLSFYELGKYNDACNDFLQALNIKKDDINLLFPLAQTDYKLAKSKEALTLIEQIIIINPGFGKAYELKGTIARENGNFDEAVKAIGQYTKINPTDSKAYNSLAETYLDMKVYDKAIFNVNTAIALEPTNANSFKIKGMIYLTQNQTEEGCNNLFKALQLGYLENVSYDILDLYLKKCESE